jgi:hypothetical protein
MTFAMIKRATVVTMKRFLVLTSSLVLALLIAAASAPAGTTPEFAIVKFTVDGGGGKSTGGAYTLTGTIGQPDASVQDSTGSTFALSGGFWSRISDLLFKDGFEDL